MLRGVWQLKSLTLKYCEHGGSSKGIRKLIEGPLLNKFVEASRNDSLEVKVEKANGHHPTVEGVYGARQLNPTQTPPWPLSVVLK